MFNFKKFFKKDKQEEEQPKDKQEQEQPIVKPVDNLPLITAATNPWGIDVIDLRPVTQAMTSTSPDPKMAANAVSYGGQDGTIFWAQQPPVNKTIAVNLVIPLDGSLAPGVLFMPRAMEHKWAIYFDGENLIFVRSWQRQVFVVAKTIQENDQLIIKSITGEFIGNEDADFTKAVLNFLLISHCIGEVVPAPIPKEFEPNTRQAALWAFSCYGRMAQVGTFDEHFIPTTTDKLRSNSLLHIAVARGDIAEIERHVGAGMNINAIAQDGLATLH